MRINFVSFDYEHILRYLGKKNAYNIFCVFYMHITSLQSRKQGCFGVWTVTEIVTSITISYLNISLKYNKGRYYQTTFQDKSMHLISIYIVLKRIKLSKICWSHDQNSQLFGWNGCVWSFSFPLVFFSLAPSLLACVWRSGEVWRPPFQTLRRVRPCLFELLGC